MINEVSFITLVRSQVYQLILKYSLNNSKSIFLRVTRLLNCLSSITGAYLFHSLLSILIYSKVYSRQRKSVFLRVTRLLNCLSSIAVSSTPTTTRR